MSFPDDRLDVEVDLFLGGVWANMEARLLAQSITITHGRQDESKGTNHASATVELENLDGHLTPQDPRSPHWPLIDVDLPVRILADGDARLVGSAGQILPTWPAEDISDVDDADLHDLASVDDEDLGQARVTIPVAGILRRLGQGSKPLRSPLVRHITSNYPAVSDYWPIEDGSDAIYAASGTPGGASMVVEGVSWASDSTLPGSSPLPSVSSGGTATWTAPCVGAAGTRVVESYVRCPTAPTSVQRVTLLDCFTLGTVVRWTVELVESGGFARIRIHGFDGGGGLIVDDDVANDGVLVGGGWVVVRLETTQDGGNVDWNVTWTKSNLLGDWTWELIGQGRVGTYAGIVGAIVRVGGRVDDCPAGGFSFGHMVVHDGSLSFGLGWLNPADQGYLGERTADRFTRLCAEQGVTSDVTGVEADSARMGPQRAGEFLAILNECAAAEQGIVREAVPWPGLIFHTRTSRYNHAVDLTLDAAQSQIGSPFTPSADDLNLRNDYEVRRTNGSSHRAIDQASIDGSATQRPHGLYDEQVTLNLAEDGLIADAAGWALHIGSWEGLRYPQVTIDLAKAPALISAWKLIRVGSRIQITNLPPQHPVDTVDLHVEGWSETLTPDSWVVTINCSPAGPWTVGELDDAALGRLDTSDSTTAAITSTATSFAVAHTGNRWVDSATYPTDFPFDVTVGGERMTVTAITGTSSPQTFTVQRSKNHVVKSHAAGTPLRLAQPLVLAR